MPTAKRVSLVLFVCALAALGAEVYRKPPPAVLDILKAPMTPALSISPTRDFAMQGVPVRSPPIAELAEPMLRLAGIGINPKTNGLHNRTFNTALSLRRIPEGTQRSGSTCRPIPNSVLAAGGTRAMGEIRLVRQIREGHRCSRGLA